MVELYWQALCRDINFPEYSTSPEAVAASQELSRLRVFTGPKANGRVTTETLFRGSTPDDLLGPYISQLLIKPFSCGQMFVSGQITTYLAGTDYLTDQASWLAARNGQGPFPPNQADTSFRYIRNGRDLSAYVHTDQAYQAFYNAAIFLATNGTPPNKGNPYLRLTKQAPFATFGVPHFLSLLAEVAQRALKAVWYSKWFVHRTLRPEDFGGLIHMHKTNQASYPLHPSALDSEAVSRVVEQTATYLLPQAFPEGCPLHPSYAEGHSSIAGACATILKAAFDGDTKFESLRNGTIQAPSQDGLTLLPYEGFDASEITVGGEINKLASNIGLGRDFAGVHWRSDSFEGLKLGESVALSILRDQRELYAERFSGFRITRFDGTTLEI